MKNIRLTILLLVKAACMLFVFSLMGNCPNAFTESTASPKKAFFSNFIAKEKRNVDASILVEYAKGFVGTPYEYGGDSPAAFDCSGFTMYIMSSFGVDLPHSASRQSNCGTKISSDELIPGDLVFFATYGGRSITHVGLYIGGNAFIHSASKGVMINNLDESYYKRCYVTAVRLTM